MCRHQVRAGFGGAYALDFGAIMLTGQALGAPMALLADVMTAVEPAIVRGLRSDEGRD